MGLFGIKPAQPKHLNTGKEPQDSIIARQEREPVRPHSHNPRKAAREPRTWSER